MKRLIFILMMAGLYASGQEVGDATIQTYADTYINTNGTGSITGAQMNQVLSYLIDSKVNHDSATTVRIATTKDSLFITYHGFAEDTIVLDESFWSRTGAVLSPETNTDSVVLGSGDAYEKLNVEGGIRTTGKIGIGITPVTALHIQDSTGSLGINPYMFSSTAGQYPQLNFGKFNGSPSSYAAIATSTLIGGINFNASEDASGSVLGGAIRLRSTQLWAAETHGNEMLFYTTENDSAAADISVRIDSNANVLIPYGDAVTYGGYSTWTPTWVWTGGNIGTPPTVVARYSVINRTVYFYVDAQGTNESGSASTAFNITLPETVKDVDAYIPCNGSYNATSKVAYPTSNFVFLVDAETNLKAYSGTISIGNTADYRIILSGHYEITNK